MIIPLSNRVSVVSELNLYICGQKIAKVTSCKYLGIYIDNRLKWDIRVDNVYKKLIKFTSIFYKLRGVLKMSCLKKLNFALVHPHILYGIEVYAKAAEYVADKLHKLNKKILRIC